MKMETSLTFLLGLWYQLIRIGAFRIGLEMPLATKSLPNHGMHSQLSKVPFRFFTKDKHIDRSKRFFEFNPVAFTQHKPVLDAIDDKQFIFSPFTTSIESYRLSMDPKRKPPTLLNSENANWEEQKDIRPYVNYFTGIKPLAISLLNLNKKTDSHLKHFIKDSAVLANDLSKKTSLKLKPDQDRLSTFNEKHTDPQKVKTENNIFPTDLSSDQDNLFAIISGEPANAIKQEFPLNVLSSKNVAQNKYQSSHEKIEPGIEQTTVNEEAEYIRPLAFKSVMEDNPRDSFIFDQIYQSYQRDGAETGGHLMDEATNILPNNPKHFDEVHYFEGSDFGTESNAFGGRFGPVSSTHDNFSPLEENFHKLSSNTEGFGSFVSADKGYNHMTPFFGGFQENDKTPSFGFDQQYFEDVPSQTGHFGTFSSDDSNCDNIESRTCSSNSECSCYGLYHCKESMCVSNEFLSSDMGQFEGGLGEPSSAALGTWHESPVDVGTWGS